MRMVARWKTASRGSTRPPRTLWGKSYHLSVDKKGFEGEEYTIAADTFPYQDMGVPAEEAEVVVINTATTSVAVKN